jgi:hypothetical protein
MICVSMTLTSSEWVQIWTAATRQWPDTELSRNEICRRYVLIGAKTLKNIPNSDCDRITHELATSMSAEDNKLET